MSEGGNINIIQDSLWKARKYYDEKNYGRSFAHYLVVFQLLPLNDRYEYEKEFTNVLNLWGSILHANTKYDDVFKCYNLAIKYFPTSVEISNNLGVHALKLTCYTAAKTYFKNSLSYDPHFLPAEQNLQTTRYALVERWHFPMLNDTIRNKAYAQAIFTEISHGFTHILDVGTGTGILSLFASKSKQCKSITACDYSETMFEIATKVLHANNGTKVRLIKKPSHSLLIPNDLKRKATLLVTEIIDSGIFGENILETLVHAWENLLTPFPYGKVIPAGVSVYLAGIQCPAISRKVRLLPRANNLLNVASLNLIYLAIPYDAENLRTKPVTYITESTLAVYVDFNNLNQLKTIINNKESFTNCNLTCLKNGTIDAFAFWFNLHLTDTIAITNDPKAPQQQTCWDQAIINLVSPRAVIENENVKVKFSCYQGFIQANCEPPGKNKRVVPVPKQLIRFLNDFELLNKLEELAHFIVRQYDRPFTILDLSPFPIFGLLLIKYGDAHLTYRTKRPIIESIVKQLCVLNDINVANILFVKEDEFNAYTNAEIEFDVIFQNVIDTCGLLSEMEIYQTQVMKYSLTELGVFVPNKIEVWAQIVDCDWLNRATRVDDRNVCGFRVAEFINEYKSTEQRDMNFDEIIHSCLSEPLNLGFICFDITNPKISTTRVPIIQAGNANAVFYWFDIELYPGITTSTRRPDSFTENAAFMFDTVRSVQSGDTLCLSLKQHKGILKIFISEIG